MVDCSNLGPQTLFVFAMYVVVYGSKNRIGEKMLLRYLEEMEEIYLEIPLNVVARSSPQRGSPAMRSPL